MPEIAENNRRIDIRRLAKDVRSLSLFGRTAAGGINRPAYSDNYMEAAQWLSTAMTDVGLSVRVDAVGNIVGRIGPEGPALLCGSHIDTVPDGGRYDGALGVLTALECVRVLQEAGHHFASPLEVIAFADEEGAYGSLLGSRAMTGALTLDEIERAIGPSGQRLAEAMRQAGFDAGRFATAVRPRSDYLGYIELHIEQGPVLEAGGQQIGVVTAIAGIGQADHIFTGSPDHAGTTPTPMRKDALRSAVDFVNRAFALLERECDADARLTFGVVNVKPNAANVVPGQVRLRQEVRHPSMVNLDAFVAALQALAAETGKKSGIRVDYVPVSRDLSCAMSQPMQTFLGEICAELDLRFINLPSGAGHDAQSFAPLCPTGMIFVPSLGGRSHCPEEETSLSAMADGANVLLNAIARLTSCPWPSGRQIPAGLI